MIKKKKKILKYGEKLFAMVFLLIKKFMINILIFKEINGEFAEMFGKEKLLSDIYIFINIKEIKLLLQKKYNYLNKYIIYIYVF